MTIGQLAQESSIDTQTIRYYERLGLLAAPSRTDSNYRVYDRAAVDRLEFIKRAKEIGFSLNDIKVLLRMADGKLRKCADIKAFAETRLAKTRAQIADLRSMEKALTGLVKQCVKSTSLDECPILESLTTTAKR